MKIKFVDFIPVIVIVLLICFTIYTIVNHINRRNRDIYTNLKCRIVSIQAPTNWRRGKFSGIDKRWLLQNLKDTTLFCEWEQMNDRYLLLGIGRRYSAF